MSVQRAEYERLKRALAEGPGRRIAFDTEAGRVPTRADVEQASRYESLMAVALAAAEAEEAAEGPAVQGKKRSA